MKHIAILFAVSLLVFAGCRPQPIKDAHVGASASAEVFAQNSEIVLEKVVNLYRQTATVHLETAYKVSMDAAEKQAGQDVKKFREWNEEALRVKAEGMAKVETEIAKIRTSFTDARIDFENYKMLDAALTKYLNAKSVDPAQASELIEMVLNKIIKKKEVK